MERKIYKHVIVLGIDGAGAFIKKATTPNFDRIFSNGAVTFNALASNPTISAECWGSMLFGVTPDIHGLTNEIVKVKNYPLDSKFPSLFKRINSVMPNAKLGSYCNWNPITTGMVENNLNVSTATASDDELAPIICDYIQNQKPNFLFVQFDSVDGAGHKHGYGSPEYYQQISNVDKLVGTVYDTVNQTGILSDTLFIVVSDHGGLDHSHGGWSDEEKLVTLAVIGESVINASIPIANVKDISAIVLYALGVAQPEFCENGWTSQVPNGIFKELTNGVYHDANATPNGKQRISKNQHSSEEV
jgi:predicted AlkP superfamily pyrophosphatase or phosphodiesterase